MINFMFGSNRLIGTDIPIVFRDNGKDTELFRYSLRDSDGKPMIDVEIRDDQGDLLGKVWKSTSFVHVDKGYNETTQMDGNEVKRLTLTRRSDSVVVFDLILHSPTSVELNGIFHIRGYPHAIIATPQVLKIGGNSFIQNTIAKRGAGVILTRNGFMI